MLKLLYICTHNRCRSILSEAITNHLASDYIVAKSAGSAPSGEVHPLSLGYLKKVGISTQGLVSESWDCYQDFSPHIVITVCDSAAAEVCPLWMGNNIKLHWGLSDPSKVVGTDEQIEQAFLSCIEQIKQRVNAMLTLDLPNLSQAQLEQQLKELGAE